MRYALLALLALGCKTVEIAPRPDPFPIPRSVPSQLGPVPVLVVDSILGGDPRLNLMGAFDAWKRVIYLRRQLSPLQMYMVLQHERCHVALFDNGLRQIVHPQLVDAICDAWGTATTADHILSQPSR